jgi:predicted nuclease with TOPRIM domain
MRVYREYEARIAELKEQFGQEQADKTKLQLELDKLQKEWDEQLQTLQTQVYYGMVSIIVDTENN